MITEREWEAEHDPRCEDCGRSMMTRFGGEIGSQFCPSCEDDWHRLSAAGKLQLEAA